MMTAPSSTSLSLPTQRTIAMKQIGAGITLIVKSGLMEFDRGTCLFGILPENEFEFRASELDPNFGRLMYWIWFSTGAEYLLKGFLILQDPSFLRSAMKFETPPKPGQAGTAQSASWAQSVIDNSAPKASQNDFGTMGKAVGLARKLATPLDRGVVPAQTAALKAEAAYIFLANAIRNRDSHAYVPDVRKDHHHMNEIFAPAFNVLIAAVGIENVLSELS